TAQAGTGGAEDVARGALRVVVEAQLVVEVVETDHEAGGPTADLEKVEADIAAEAPGELLVLEVDRVSDQRGRCGDARAGGIERVVFAGVDQVLQDAADAVVVVDAGKRHAAMAGVQLPICAAEQVGLAFQAEREVTIGVATDGVTRAERGKAVVQRAFEPM